MNLQRLILFYILMIVNGCESLIDKIIIYPTVDERMRWDMSELFEGSALEYQFSIRQADEFNIISSFQQQKNTEHIDSVEQIIDLATLKQEENNAWLNKFAFIEQDVESVDIFYNSIPSYKTPQFDKIISVSTVQWERCFSLEFLQYNQFIVDCGIVDGINPIHNQFLIVDLEGNKIKITNDNLKKVISVKKRQIITSFKNNNQLLIRANYEDNNQSFIESFKINTDHTNLYNNLFIFDSNDLQTYLNDDQAQFNLLDIQITPDSLLYILDKYFGLFIVEFTKSYDFKIIQQILPLQQELIAFYTGIYLENNGNIRYTVLLYKQTIYIYQDLQFLKIIDLDYEINTHATISIANKFIIINYKSTFYQYNLFTSNFISKTLSEGQNHYLTNPYMPDLVSISNVQAHRFYISNGYFEVLPYNKVSPIEFTTDLIAIEYNNRDITKQQCSISIQYQRLSKNEKQLFKLTQTLPSVVSSPSEPFVLKSLVSGPAIIYQQNPQSKSEFQVQDMWDIQVNFKFPENPKFGSTLKGEDTIYFLFQQDNLIIIIYECMEITLEQLKCSEYTQIKIQFILTYDNFEWWLSDNQLYISYSDGKILTLSIILDGQQELIQTITQVDKINSFLVMDTSVYLVDQEAETITCFSSFFPTLVSTILDQAWINKMGLNIQWKPKKVFGNKFSNSHLIFVQNGDSLIIIDCHKGYTPITQIQFPYTKLEVFVAINTKSFFIILDGYEIDLIQEYSLVNLNDIYFMKEIPLYTSYQFSSPLNVDYCKENGYLFIRTYSFISQKIEILLYAPNQLAHDSLKKIIPTEQLISSSQSIILSVSGNNNMYAYINVKGESKIKCLLKQPLLIIQTDMDNEEYISKSTLKMFIQNYWGNSQIPFEGDIVIVNTYTYIKLDESKLRETNKLYLQDKSKQYQYLLNDNWYQGQVVSFNIDCNKQPKNIYFKNKVEYEKDQVIIIQDHSLKSYIQYDDNTFIIQGERQLLFMTQNDQLIKYINLQIPQNYICSQSVIGEQGKLIYSLCSDDSSQVIHVSQCINENCFPLGIKIQFSHYAQIRNVKKIGLIGKQLFILNADNTNNWVGDVIMYKLQFEDDSFPLKDPVFINKQYFNVLFDLYYTDISINLFDSLAYIFILDAFKGISIIEGKVGQDGYLILTNRQYFDMSKYIINQGIYLKDDSQFIALQYISHYRDLILNVAMIIVTNNAPQFGIRIVFDEKIYIKVDYILNQYGSWQAQPIVLYRKSYAVIQYCSMFHKFVAVYKIPTNLNDNIVELIRIHGGIQYQTLEPYQFNFLSGNLDLFALEQNNLIKYNVFDQNSIIIKAQTDKQLCLVKGQNDFNSQSIETVIDVYYEQDNSNLWWIILLSVIGLVIIITGSVYIYKRKQPKRVFNIQLLDDQV